GGTCGQRKGPHRCAHSSEALHREGHVRAQHHDQLDDGPWRSDRHGAVRRRDGGGLNMATLATTRQGKTAIIGEVKARFDRATSAVLLDYKGMTVETATKLRAQFRKVGVEYKVVKNTLVKQALKESAYHGKLDDVLVGMTGIAWSYEDPSAAAKVVKAF